MSGKKQFIFISILFGCFNILRLQAQDTEVAEQFIEGEFSETEEVQDFSELKEKLNYFVDHPLDLNTCNEADFEKLGFLTCFKIAMILDYRKEKGPFLSTFELNGVEGLSLQDVRMILPFVKVGDVEPVESKKRIFQQLKTTSAFEWPQKVGFQKDSAGIAKFAGAPYNLRMKYRGEFSAFQAGITAEKDAGEAYLKNQGFDFYSAYFQYSGEKMLKNLIMGDFTASFGQGLVLWNGFSTGMNSNVANIRKLRAGFNHYTSVSENLYFRGVSNTLQFGNFQVSSFASNKNIDATQHSIDSSIFVTSFKTTGLHATSNDIKDRKCLNEKTFGGNLSFDKNALHLGITACQSQYDLPVIPEATIENQFKFSGKKWYAIGLDYLVRGRKYELFGEIAHSSNRGNAGNTGIQLQILPEIAFSCMYRNYQADYFSAYASGFARNTKTCNERGVYMGLELNPLAKLRIVASSDFYENYWLTALLNEPQQAAEYFLECTYLQSLETSFNFRYGLNSKKIAVPGTNAEPKSSIYLQTQRFRTQLNYKPLGNMELRSRFELSYIDVDKQLGILIFQDILWKIPESRVSISGRYLFFNTDGWDSRIYAFENDIFNSYSFPAYSGKGSTFNLSLVSKISRNFQFSMRFSNLCYFDRSEISSGVNAVNSNTLNELSCQFLILF